MSNSAPLDAVSTDCAGLTDVGRVRRQNEDSILVREDLGLFVVADGMGGHQAGDLASQITVAQLAKFFEQSSAGHLPVPVPAAYREFDPGAQRLLVAILHANRQVRAAAKAAKGRDGMGSTVVAVHVCPDGMVHIAHVGDSRVYRISGGEIEQVTQDHSFFNQVRWKSPGLEPELLAALPKNVITKALGMQDEAEPEVRTEMSLHGDTYLLCSDGLSGMISNEEILQTVLTTDSIPAACQSLIDQANGAGGKDNVSVVIVRVEHPLQIVADGPPNCPRCGVALLPGTAFCVECGMKL
ncbi:MAG: protein phosphatase 2C domain-containing protein [Deltaproteobacteria bacterium]|nr:protein phosphatase 2C domain-containing protein [Deltaproteobacteria bacterium]